jgi:hypothetical protein
MTASLRLDFLDIKHAEILFVGVGEDLEEEDEDSLLASDLDQAVAQELNGAAELYGEHHLDQKLIADLLYSVPPQAVSTEEEKTARPITTITSSPSSGGGGGLGPLDSSVKASRSLA